MNAAATARRPAALHPRALLLAVAAVAALYPAVSAPAQMLKARGAGADLRLLSTAGEHRIVIPGVGRVPLPLSAAASVGDFRIAGGDWLVAAVDREREHSPLVVLEGRADRLSVLPVPDLEGAKAVREPRLLVAGDRLDGLLWLEGVAADRMEVRAARWTGGGWELPATVSAAGPGTQIALTAAVLADGSRLAAWAAFDGKDDEILWSRLRPGAAGDGWSPPRPVAEDNAVPDITPALTATAAGALLAWSRWDGHHYRVHLARFDGAAWSEPQVVGARGSAFPVFAGDDPPVLIYRQAEPDAWRVAELDAGGEVRRQAEAAALDPGTPVLADIDDEVVVLEWAEVSATVNWLPAPPGRR